MANLLFLKICVAHTAGNLSKVAFGHSNASVKISSKYIEKQGRVRPEAAENKISNKVFLKCSCFVKVQKVSTTLMSIYKGHIITYRQVGQL